MKNSIQEKSKMKKKWLLPILAVLIVVGAGAALITVRSGLFNSSKNNAVISGSDRQVVKGLGGGLPWYTVGAPISEYPLAAQTLLDMGTSVVRVYIHNQADVFDEEGNLKDFTLANAMVSEIKWAEANKIPYNYTPGWNNLPAGCYSDGLLLEQYEQAQCNSVKNMLNYFTSKGCPLPLVTSLANEPDCPLENPLKMIEVPVEQFQRTFKLLRTTLDGAGLSDLDLTYSEGGFEYLGDDTWSALSGDPELDAAIGAFANHSYGSKYADDKIYIDNYNKLGKERDRWMTEYCYLPEIDGVKGKDYTTGTVERFISDMAMMQYNYWETWQIWNNNGPAGTDTICSGNGKDTVTIAPAYYVFKKIFTNVTPGSRVRRISTDDLELKFYNNIWMDAIAFVNESKMVAVFVNPTSNDKDTNVSGLTGSKARVYQISTKAAFNTDMELVNTKRISKGKISGIDLPAKSITVIVTDGGTDQSEPPKFDEDAIPDVATAVQKPGVNLLQDTDFKSSYDDSVWGFNLFDSKAELSFAEGQAVIKISQKGSQIYMPQLVQAGFGIFEGKTYRASFDAKASKDRTIEFLVNTGPSDYVEFLRKKVELTTEMKTYTFTFTPGLFSDDDSRIDFNLGMDDGDVTIENVFFGLDETQPEEAEKK